MLGTSKNQKNYDQNNLTTQTILKQYPQTQIPDQIKQNEKDHQQTQDRGGIFLFMKDFVNLYHYGQVKDKLLLIFGILVSLISGLAYPMFTYFWGKQIDHINLNYHNLSQTLYTSRYNDIALILIGIVALLVNGLAFSLWKLLSVNISQQFRIKYLNALSKKSAQWIEKQNLFENSSKFKLNCLNIQKAIGDKTALFYNLNGILLAGSITAVCIRWTFALFLFALLPICIGALSSFLYVLIKKKMYQKQFYKKAQAQSFEATSMIKTVKMLGAQEYQQNIYMKRLEEYEQNLRHQPLKLAITTGIFYFIQYLMFGVGYMYGIQCVRGTGACPIDIIGSHYTVGDIHIVFFQIFFCSYNFLQLATNFEAVKSAIESSKDIFKFVEETQLQQKQTLTKIENSLSKIQKIQFKNVNFAYPLNPEKVILENISLSFLKNKFNAVVGFTGSGKSTIIQLLLNYYGVNSGQILINDANVKEIGEKALRNVVGYVGQQPSLFSGSIKENIRVGKDDATDQQIFEVLKLVNLYDFVKAQSQGLNFNIGFGGSKISGGQKQRIAIARTIIKKPKLLIFDEATSALDRKSQKIIQQTIKSILLNDCQVTVICIAHRLRTIFEADKIWYIEEGVVKGTGKFEDIEYFKDIKMDVQDQNQAEGEVIKNIKTIKRSLTKEYTFSKTQIEGQSSQQGIYKKLFSFIKVKKWYVIGIVAAILNGISHPIGAILISYIYDETLKVFLLGKALNWCQNSLNYSLCIFQIDNYHNNAKKFLFGMIGFSFYIFIPYFVQTYVMAKIEDQITKKIRGSLFNKLLALPIQWHERQENEGGKAASRCSIDAKEVGGLITNYIPTIIANCFTILGGIIIPLIYNWKLGLISLAITPLIAFGGYISMKFVGGYNDQTIHRYSGSDKTANQFIMSIRTIISFNYQNKMIQRYQQQLHQPVSDILKRGAKIGLFYGSSQLTLFVSISILFYACTIILTNISDFSSIDFIVIFTVPGWSGWIAGNSFFFASQASSGKKSAENIFAILQTKEEKDLNQKCLKLSANDIRGKIQFRNVSFRYGVNENEKIVVKNVSFVIEAGKKVAFVGSSGCGKSTLLQLLQRMYEFEGEILLDDVNIFDYDLKKYRSYFGVVNQEPSLFMGTLKENIVFNMDSVKDEELLKACELSCAFDLRQFQRNIDITENVKSFLQKQVGPKGSKISGGEKQRVAAARALLRKPQIFLMDEGTSALDRQTQKLLQQNLDMKLRGKTIVSIAHRIETIQNSDCIFLFENGRLIEQGTYKELMQRKTAFERFVKGAQ